MAKSVDEIMEYALELSKDEQAQLIELLRETLVKADLSGKPSREWMELARQRAEELRTGQVVGIPADEVLAKLRFKLHK